MNEGRRDGPDGRSDPWPGETVRLVTRHGKDGCIAPALAGVGLRLVTADADTDALGTFTGTVSRSGAAHAVAARKAVLGLGESGLRLGVASEGSFGAHPALPLLTADDEVVVLVDHVTGVVVRGRAVRAAEVAVTGVLGPRDDLASLIARADLPRHRLSVRPDTAQPRRGEGTTGLGSAAELEAAVRRWSPRGREARVVVSTDFRAHVCPSRRAVIAEAAADLAHRLGQRCPRCRTPGWGLVRLLDGAPCGWCSHPTHTVRSEEWGCVVCPHRVERAREAVTGDPATCGRCNP